MKLIAVKFLTHWDKYNAGEVAGFDEKTVDVLEARQIAVRLGAPSETSQESLSGISDEGNTPPATGTGAMVPVQDALPSPAALKAMNKLELADLAKARGLEVPEDLGTITKDALIALVEAIRTPASENDGNQTE